MCVFLVSCVRFIVMIKVWFFFFLVLFFLMWGISVVFVKEILDLIVFEILFVLIVVDLWVEFEKEFVWIMFDYEINVILYNVEGFEVCVKEIFIEFV